MTQAQQPDTASFTPEMGPKRMTVAVDGETFLPTLGTVANLAESARLKFTSESIDIRTTNPNCTALADVQFTNIEYETDLPEPVTVGVDLDDFLAECIGFYQGDLALTLRSDQPELVARKTDTLGDTDLLDPATLPEMPAIERPDYDASVSATVPDLKAAVARVSGVGRNEIVVDATEPGLKLRAPTPARDEHMETPTCFPVDGEPAEAAVNSGTLWNVLGAMFPSGDVTLRLSDDRVLELAADDATYLFAARPPGEDAAGVV
jgi:hypothetical protein